MNNMHRTSRRHPRTHRLVDATFPPPWAPTGHEPLDWWMQHSYPQGPKESYVPYEQSAQNIQKTPSNPWAGGCNIPTPMGPKGHEPLGCRMQHSHPQGPQRIFRRHPRIHGLVDATFPPPWSPKGHVPTGWWMQHSHPRGPPKVMNPWAGGCNIPTPRGPQKLKLSTGDALIPASLSSPRLNI